MVALRPDCFTASRFGATGAAICNAPAGVGFYDDGRIGFNSGNNSQILVR
jgi:hypothetical protein